MIIRRKHNSNFTVIPNAIATDARLSIEARWLMVYLLSRPDEWELQIGDIQAVGSVGRDKAYRMVSECVAAGYIERVNERDLQGRARGVSYLVRDQQDGGAQPLPEKPEAGSVIPDSGAPLPEKPHPAEPDPVNTDGNKNLESTRTETTLPRLSAERLRDLETRMREAGGEALNTVSTGLLVLAEPLRWLAAGCDLELDILPIIRARCQNRRPGSVRSWGLFADAVYEARDRRNAPLPEAGSHYTPGASPPRRERESYAGIAMELERSERWK